MPRIHKRCTVRRFFGNQRGNNILEAALIILPLLAIGFALIDYSISLFVQNTLRNAVREGVRFAITQQTGAGGQDAAIKTVVQNNSMGFLTNANYISVSYLDQGTLLTVTGTGSNAQGNICIVSITAFPWPSLATIWRSAAGLQFTVSSSDVMEAPPNGVLPSR